MRTQASETRRRWLVWVGVLLISVVGWKLYDKSAAVREAEALGWTWNATTPFDHFRRDWRTVLDFDYWERHPRGLGIEGCPDLSPHRDLIRRLRPEEIYVHDCENMDAIQGLTSLEYLQVTGSPVPNLDMLKGLTSLRKIQLWNMEGLSNLDALKDLPKVEVVDLQHCPALKNLDALAALPNLRELTISDCQALVDLHALKKNTRLEELWITESNQILSSNTVKVLKRLKTLHLDSEMSVDDLRELRAALPKLQVTFPSEVPPLSPPY